MTGVDTAIFDWGFWFFRSIFWKVKGMWLDRSQCSWAGSIGQELSWECDLWRQRNKQADTLHFRARHFGVGALGSPPLAFLCTLIPAIWMGWGCPGFCWHSCPFSVLGWFIKAALDFMICLWSKNHLVLQCCIKSAILIAQRETMQAETCVVILKTSCGGVWCLLKWQTHLWMMVSVTTVGIAKQVSLLGRFVWVFFKISI